MRSFENKAIPVSSPGQTAEHVLDVPAADAEVFVHNVATRELRNGEWDGAEQSGGGRGGGEEIPRFIHPPPVLSSGESSASDR